MRIKVLLLTVVLIISSISVTNKEVTSEELTGGEILEGLIKEDACIQEEYNKQLEEKNSYNQQVIWDLEERFVDGEQYVDGYAGCYLNGHDKVVLLLDDSYNDSILDINSDEIDIKYVEFSYCQLYEVKDKYEEILEELVNKDNTNCLTYEEEKVFNNVISISISVEKNCVEIGLISNNKGNLEEFYKVFPKEKCVRFKRESTFLDNKTSIYSGTAVYSKSGEKKYISSIGPRCSYTKSDGTEVKGFLTTAHGFHNGVGEKAYINSNCIGKVRKWRYSGKVDAVFIEVTNSNYNMTKYAYNINNDSKIKLDMGCETVGNCVGETFYKVGEKTGKTKGKVIKEGASYKMEAENCFDGKSHIWKDMWFVSYDSDSGDSGGVVYDDVKNVCGIHKGRHEGYSVVVNIDNIDTVFGTFVY